MTKKEIFKLKVGLDIDYCKYTDYYDTDKYVKQVIIDCADINRPLFSKYDFQVIYNILCEISNGYNHQKITCNYKNLLVWLNEDEELLCNLCKIYDEIDIINDSKNSYKYIVLFTDFIYYLCDQSYHKYMYDYLLKISFNEIIEDFNLIEEISKKYKQRIPFTMEILIDKAVKKRSLSLHDFIKGVYNNDKARNI